MPSTETVVTNLPVWTLWVIAIAQILFALATLLIALAVFMLKGAILSILGELQTTMKEVNKGVPPIMQDVKGITGNAKLMSDDARQTTKQVTGAVNKVADVTHGVATRLESPLVKSVGLISGLLAGARALKGSQKRVVVVEEKKRGLLGRKK